jgi:hypothetical protein
MEAPSKCVKRKEQQNKGKAEVDDPWKELGAPPWKAQRENSAMNTNYEVRHSGQ